MFKKNLFIIIILILVIYLFNNRSIFLIFGNKIIYFYYYFLCNYSNIDKKIYYGKTDLEFDKNLIKTINKYGKRDINVNFVKSKTFNFYDIQKHCNYYVEKLYNKEFLNKVSNILDISAIYFQDPDKNPMNFVIKLYKKNSFFDYHFDDNYSLGTRYTVVIPLYYNKYNTSNLKIINKNNKEETIKIAIGNFIIYKGGKIYHSVSKQHEKGIRLSLIINLTTNRDKNFVGNCVESFTSLKI